MSNLPQVDLGGRASGQRSDYDWFMSATLSAAGESRTRAIHLVVVDDHVMVRQSIADRLRAEPDLDVMGTASTETDAIEALSDHRPDIAIIDARLGDGDGIAVAEWISVHLPDCASIIVTGHPSDEAMVRAYEAGAAAFMAKAYSLDELLLTVRDVASGIRHLSPENARAASRRLSSRGPSIRSLDATDRAILSALVAGKRDRDIAATVMLSTQTVRNRMSRMLERLDLENRVQLAVFASHHIVGRDDARADISG